MSDGTCRQLLVDMGVTSTSRYSRTKEGLRTDRRYKAMAKDAREPAFKHYVAQLQVCTSVASFHQHQHGTLLHKLHTCTAIWLPKLDATAAYIHIHAAFGSSSRGTHHSIIDIPACMCYLVFDALSQQ